MIKDLLNYTFSFILLLLVQILLLNHLYLSTYINPYLYVLFILMLPFEIPNLLLLILSLVAGLIVDLFSSSMGIHASACVFIAFVRPYLLKLISPRDGYEFGFKPRVKYMGWKWFITYSGIIIVLHHIFLFYVDTFSMIGFFSTLSKALLSSIFTFVLVLISELFIYNRS